MGTGGVLDVCMCLVCSGVSGYGLGPGSGGVGWCYVCLSRCVDGRSRYLYIMLGGYLHILGAPSVQSCCTLSISASYHVFVYGRYGNCLCVVVGPGFFSTSAAFMRSSARHPAALHGRLAPPPPKW